MPFTRYDSRTAYDALFGARLALREWNARGGVMGYRVELVAQDDENDAEVAAGRARELAIDRDVLGVIGHLSNDTALKAVGEYRKAGLPLLTFASASALTTEAGRGVLRLGPNDEQLAMAVLDDLSGKFSIDRVAIVERRSLVSIGSADVFEREIVGRGGSVVLRENVDRADRDFGDIFTQSKASRVTLVVFLGGYRQAAAFYTGLHRELEQTAFIAVGSDTPDFPKIGGENLLGAMYVAPWPLLNRQEDPGKEFFGKYVALAGAEPSRYGPISYDAVNLLLGAAERSYRATGKLTREGVLDQLESSEPVTGVSGVLAFDEHGDLKSPKPMVYRIEEKGVYPGVAIK